MVSCLKEMSSFQGCRVLLDGAGGLVSLEQTTGCNVLIEGFHYMYINMILIQLSCSKGSFMHIKAWDMHILCQKYGVVKLVVSGQYFEIYLSDLIL